MIRMIAGAFGLGCLIGLLALTLPGRAVLAVSAAPLRMFGGFAKPTRSILIIGNSRTYYHDMPTMVQRMAESAHAPVRYSITLKAWGGADFEANWTDAEVQSLLAKHWDEVILQPASRAETSAADSENSATYGEKMIFAAHATQSPVSVIVNWGYGEALYAGDPPQMRQQYIDTVETATGRLASNAGAQLIDTSRVWEQVHAEDASLDLYEDGNHPTVYGSYLSALMIYGFLDHADVANVTFVPSGADEHAIQTIKAAVVSYYSSQA